MQHLWVLRVVPDANYATEHRVRDMQPEDVEPSAHAARRSLVLHCFLYDLRVGGKSIACYRFVRTMSEPCEYMMPPHASG